MSGLRSSREGMTGTGARDYRPDPGLLAGVLASDEPKAYPDNYCIECVRAGIDSDRCFHKHWQTTDEPRARETR
jgi:hypothetical protein